MKSIKTHLGSRFEKRFTVKDKSKLIDTLKANKYKQKIYSDNHISLTIYFNVPSEPLDFDTSIKARRYIQERYPKDKITLDDGLYYLDIKKTSHYKGRSEYKEKERFYGSLKEILSYLSKEFHPKIKPVLAIQYKRKHFLGNHNNKQVRITIDENVDFFMFFEENNIAKYIGSEKDVTRLEIKSEEPNIGEVLLKNILHYPIISKGCSGFNFMCNATEKHYGKNEIVNELPGVEIESKLVSNNSERILNEIKNLFDNTIDEFSIDSSYPWIHNSASINRYYNGDNPFRAALCDNRVKITEKDNGSPIENKNNLNCIFSRGEHKGKWISLWENKKMENGVLLSEFLRVRRAFWPINLNTKRVYHISYDVCFDETGKELRQIEVEYVGRFAGNLVPTDTADIIRHEVISDISKITSIILNNFEEMEQSTIQKQKYFSKN